MSFKRPRPRPPKGKRADTFVDTQNLAELSQGAEYVGSPHHTDIPKYQLQSQPREGFVRIEQAEDQGLKNPSCTVCPRKWAHRQADATELLRAAISKGNFVGPVNGLPSLLWARDPENPDLIYEAKRLFDPPNGYKAYPLTEFQARYNLPIEIL